MGLATNGRRNRLYGLCCVVLKKGGIVVLIWVHLSFKLLIYSSGLGLGVLNSLWKVLDRCEGSDKCSSNNEWFYSICVDWFCSTDKVMLDQYELSILHLMKLCNELILCVHWDECVI